MNNQIVEISDDIIAQFESLPGSAPIKAFTKTEDNLLLKYWPIKNHAEVANLLGRCTNTCLKRYRELINERK